MGLLITMTLLAVLLLAPTLACEAQQTAKIATIGVLSPSSRTPADDAVVDAFEQSLQGLGWVRDRNITIELRYAAGRLDTLPALAAELVSLRVDVLVAWSPYAALAAKRATSQIPVIFLAAADPVRFGLVSSLARPGGNVTGVSFEAAVETNVKGLELLKEAVPSLTRVAWLVVSGSRTTMGTQAIRAAAKTLGLELPDVELQAPAAELEAAVRKAKVQGAQALYVSPSIAPAFGKRLAELALANRLPSVHPFRENVVAGGLLSYAPSLTDIARRGAVYVDKVLKGAKPADLPVEQPMTFEFVINLKTANALGLTIPPSLLLRATHVIE